jgi:hypothetical protein
MTAAEAGVNGDDERVAPRDWFYPNHLGKLVVFGLAGGVPFFLYWAYRSWTAYATNGGYSRRPFWRRVRKRTGYRPSPFWRAVFLDPYLLCLFPAVDRECRQRGVRGVRAAEGLALAFSLLVFARSVVEGFVEKSLLSPVWAVIPVQLAVNRLHATEGRRVSVTTDGWELIWVAVGVMLALRQLIG